VVPAAAQFSACGSGGFSDKVFPLEVRFLLVALFAANSASTSKDGHFELFLHLSLSNHA
jgi:hypothetical protein